MVIVLELIYQNLKILNFLVLIILILYQELLKQIILKIYQKIQVASIILMAKVRLKISKYHGKQLRQIKDLEDIHRDTLLKYIMMMLIIMNNIIYL